MHSLAAVIQQFKGTACYKELKTLCDEYDAESKESAGNVELKDRILAACHKYQQSYQQQFHSKQVGAMEGNRGGEGVQWRRAHGRVQVIKTSGFSLAAIKHNAVAGEDNPYTKEYAKYTVKQCATHPCFAKYQEDEIRIGAWGATHALHGFACVHDRVKSEYESLTKDGYMDLDVVCNRDKSGLLRDAIVNGVKFTVVKWVVHAALPMVAKIVGDALNTVQQTSEGCPPFLLPPMSSSLFLFFSSYPFSPLSLAVVVVSVFRGLFIATVSCGIGCSCIVTAAAGAS